MCDILKTLSLQKFRFWLTSQTFFIGALVVFRILRYINIHLCPENCWVGWCNVNTLDLYLGKVWFGSWKWHWISWL